jgi:chromosome partitioning protein
MPDTRLRNTGVKIKLAKEFCGFTGTDKVFRAIFSEREKADGQYHRTYSGADVRFARAKLMKTTVDAVERRDGELPPIINCRMSKGGTGKTTVAGNLAATLAAMSFKVLAIDADAQSSLSGLYGIDWATEDITHIGELMQTNLDPKQRASMPALFERAVWSIYPEHQLDLIASDITLADADSWLMGTTNREATFDRLLKDNRAFFSQYDVIIIDSAPGSTILTNTFMYSSKLILAVVWLDGQSIKALEVLSSNINELNQAFGEGGLHLDIHIIANGLQQDRLPSMNALSRLMAEYPAQLNDTVIPHSVSFMRQMDLFDPANSGPVLEREPNSVSARAIIDIAKSLVRLYNIKLGNVAAGATSKAAKRERVAA